jgi:ribonuclease P protein component
VPGQFTFPKAERLTLKSEYRHVFKNGEKFVGRHFICYLVRPENEGSKLGFAVSRKVGNAIERNRIKRYLREIYRTMRPRFSTDVLLVIVARPAAADLRYPQCVDAVEKLLKRGDILND